MAFVVTGFCVMSCYKQCQLKKQNLTHNSEFQIIVIFAIAHGLATN